MKESMPYYVEDTSPPLVPDDGADVLFVKTSYVFEALKTLQRYADMENPPDDVDQEAVRQWVQELTLTFSVLSKHCQVNVPHGADVDDLLLPLRDDLEKYEIEDDEEVIGVAYRKQMFIEAVEKKLA